jgi:hypothetical protein
MAITRLVVAEKPVIRLPFNVEFTTSTLYRTRRAQKTSADHSHRRTGKSLQQSNVPILAPSPQRVYILIHEEQSIALSPLSTTIRVARKAEVSVVSFHEC